VSERVRLAPDYSKEEEVNIEAVGGHIATLSRWIDESYPSGMDAELALRRRVGKIGNEFGEALQALEGCTGENPRKGVFDTIEHLSDELLDVAITALGAWEHINGNRGCSVEALRRKVEVVAERAGLND
jgi:hypothetical protein